MSETHEQLKNEPRTEFTDDPVRKSLDTGFRFLGVCMFFVVAAYLCSGVTSVKSDEVAMVLRFGRLVGATPALSVRQPGLLWALPKPVDEVVRVKTRKIYELEIKDLRYNKELTDKTRMLAQMSFNTTSIDPELEGYCLTGDRNVIQVYVVVKYQITDPVAYIFGQAEPDKLLRDVTMAAVNGSVGEMTVDSVLSEGKKQLAITVFQRTQKNLDAVGSGISLVSVEFNELVPTRHVMKDFKNVQNAYINKETKVKESMSYREAELPRAHAEHDALVREAQADAAMTLATARGAADSFRNLVAEYEKNPDVTRERLYREAIEGTIGWSGQATLVPAPIGERYENFRLFIPGE